MKKTMFLFLCFVLSAMALWGTDIDVTYIDRIPNYPYDAAKNKPDPGDIVTFVAHVKLYDSPGQNADYIWYLDGIKIGEGTVFLNPGVENTVSTDWVWDDNRHEIMIHFDPVDNISEDSEENNIVYDFTDALIVGIAVENSLVEAFPEFQIDLGIGSMSFEDWFQRQIKIWNLVLMEKAGELKSETLIDVKDRVRGVLSYHPDGTLVNGNCPFGGGTTWPEVDMQWGKLHYDVDLYRNNKNMWIYEGSLPHELSHARYLPDTYVLGYDINQVEIIDDSGVPVQQTDYMPAFSWEMLWYDKNEGMMTSDYGGRYSLFDACLLNRVAGQRALGCNTNGCCSHNTNWYTADFPNHMYLKILHLDGSPWVNAKLDIYRMESNEIVDNIIDYTLFTDSNGRAQLPSAIFTDSIQFILKITSPGGGLREYRNVEYTDFHIAFWLGEIDEFTYIINTEFDPVPVAETVDTTWDHNRGETFDITYYGRNFKKGIYFRFDPAVVRTNSVTFISPNEVRANLTILEENLRKNQIAYRMYNPDGKFVRRMDPYDKNILLIINNRKPYAHFTSFDITDRVPRAYYFNGLWSHDLSPYFGNLEDPFPLPGTGPIVAYEWDFGDGSPKKYEPFTVHQFADNGIYQVTLKVTDSDNQTASNTKTIMVGPTYTISGKVSLPTVSGGASGQAGLSGVRMNGLPTSPMTDTAGNYNDTVISGWSGTVTPQKIGYAFVPSYRSYSSVDSDRQNQDYTATYTQYSLTIVSGTGGTTDPVPGVYLYGLGAGVQVEATPNVGYNFSGWSGDAPFGHETDNPLTLTMDSDKSITARFSYTSYSFDYYIFHGHDFDGDGDSDVSVWRPSNGRWYIKDFGGSVWGKVGDIPINGDYDGDGATDIAVWRPSNGRWFLKGIGSPIWGMSGDIPVPGNYDGDVNETTDIAVWRPSNGRWFIKGFGSYVWGISGDIPVPGDYNGDGTTDIAVWRPSNGRWYIHGMAGSAWGVAGDIPVPGDYSGDGTTEIAIWRPSNGRWYIKGMAGSVWGTAGDIPAPGDYNGDGITDMAVCRPSNGRWYIKGIGGYFWGMLGDIPLVR